MTKYTKLYSDFSDPSESKTITLATIPAGTMVRNVVIRPTIQFTGGASTACFISIGIVGNEQRYIPYYDVSVPNTPNDGGGTPISSPNSIEDFDNPYDIVVNAFCADDTLDHITQGGVDIYIETVSL